MMKPKTPVKKKMVKVKPVAKKSMKASNKAPFVRFKKGGKKC